MAFARWQATIVDEGGNVLPDAEITVRREVAGAPLATIYHDRAGETPLGNPFLAGPDGLAFFHAPGGAYRITATKGAFSQTWRYVGVGLASEADTPPLGVTFTFDDGTADADPGAGAFRFDDATPANATAIYISNIDADGLDQAAWLDSLDDGGGTADRGTIVLRTGGSSALLIARVVGSVVDGGSYRKLSIQVISASIDDGFIAGSAFGCLFMRAGIDGVDGVDGEILGPGVSVDGNLAAFDGVEGDTLKDSGISLASVYRTGGPDVAISDGGTGASNAAAARANLGVGLTLLTSGAVSAVATLDIILTSYTGFRGLVLYLAGLRPSTDGADLWLRFSTNGGSSFDASGYTYAVHTINDGGFNGVVNNANANQILVAQNIGGGANEGMNGQFEILNQTSGVFWPRALFRTILLDGQATAAANCYDGGGMRKAAQDLDAVRLLFSAGNIAGGNYAVYGLS